MPKRQDLSFKTKEDGTVVDTYISQLKASKKYDKENVDNIRVRVPKGWGQKMKDYVESSNKYNSVNSMICDLIKKEIPNIEED